MVKKVKFGSRATTIVDVAKKANVSTMTVSRVIRKSEKVSSTTREKVEKAIAELDYTPNVAARALVGAHVRRICLLYQNPSSAFLSELLLGALKAAGEAGTLLIVEKMELDATVDSLESKFNTDWDALIVPPPMSDSKRLRELVKDKQFPAVFLLSADQDEDIDQININDYAAAHEMTEYLLAKGHTRIGFIKGAPSQSVSNRRLQGFIDACSKSGRNVPRELIEPGEFTYKSGQKAALRLLKQDKRPSAIFASNDDMAAGAIAAAAQLGLSVPGDVAVVGFDDSPIATIVAPSLTTVRQPVAEMAEQAVQRLLASKSSSGTEARFSKTPNHRIVERNST